MHDRSLLGAADVNDGELTLMVADLLGHPHELPAITTAGRYWVSGRARRPAGATAYRMFVKHIQAWTRSAEFEFVPPEMREMAAAEVPWRIEHLAYRSDLGDRLPDGLTMPRALGVHEPDAESAVVWLEEATAPQVCWDETRYRRAAYLLGRLAASPRVGEVRDLGEFEFKIHTYVHGRVAGQVVPALRDPGVWQHPLVTGAFSDELRERLLSAADHVVEYADELVTLDLVSSHGTPVQTTCCPATPATTSS